LSPATINIAVLHGEAQQCEALCDFISDSGVGFRVVGGTQSAADAEDLLRMNSANVLVVDLESVGEGAAELLSSVRALSPGTGILLLVRDQPLEQLEELLARGAGGFLETERASSELVAALRTLGMGRRYQSPAAVAAR
jgi:DNA-binding NarL/FixJ family response regulator